MIASLLVLVLMLGFAAPEAAEPPLDPAAVADFVRRARASTVAEVHRLEKEIRDWERNRTEEARLWQKDVPDAVAKRLKEFEPLKQKRIDRLAALRNGEAMHAPPLSLEQRVLRKGQLGAIGVRVRPHSKLEDGSVLYMWVEEDEAASFVGENGLVYRDVQLLQLRVKSVERYFDASVKMPSRTGVFRMSGDWIYRAVGVSSLELHGKRQNVWVLERVDEKALLAAYREARGKRTAGEAAER